LVVASFLAACAPKAAATTAPVAAAPAEKKLTVVHLVNGQLGDKSFTDSAHRGMLKAAEDFDFIRKTYEVGLDPAKWVPALVDTAADPEVDIIVMGSGDLLDALYEQAKLHPEKKFIMFDNPVDFTDKCKGCDNVYAVQYKQNEGSFMVGLYAGLMSKSKKIGAVGGKEIPVILDFMIGYKQGAVLAGLKEEDVLIQYIGSWNDPAKAKEIALAMYQQGADYVFQVAGGSGPGVFQAAIEAGKWALGVDSDQAVLFEDTNPDYTKVIATSMLKNVDKSLYRAFKMIFEGTMKWGINEALGIPDGAGLAYNKYYEALTPQSVKDQIAKTEADVIAGKIVVATVY
jgi:basic membrane protein A